VVNAEAAPEELAHFGRLGLAHLPIREAIREALSGASREALRGATREAIREALREAIRGALREATRSHSAHLLNFELESR
jgi:hypothetical protein